MTKRRVTRTTKKKTASSLHCTVKRHGHLEKYDERKVYGSVYAASMNSHLKHKEAEKIASAVCKTVTALVKKKKKLDSTVIFKTIIRELKKHHKDVAFMYETHRDIC